LLHVISGFPKLLKLKADEVLAKDRLRRSFRTLMKQAGIIDFKRHDLRHDAATNMVESGASLIEVRDILGHSDIRMTQRYAHAKEQGVHQAVARLAERAKKIVPKLSQEKKSRSGDLL
jgi:site-specific recombinase XerD